MAEIQEKTYERDSSQQMTLMQLTLKMMRRGMNLELAKLNPKIQKSQNNGRRKECLKYSLNQSMELREKTLKTSGVLEVLHGLPRKIHDVLIDTLRWRLI